MLAALALYGAVSLPGLEAHWHFSATGIGLLLLWLGGAAAAARMLFRQAPSREQLAMLAGEGYSFFQADMGERVYAFCPPFYPVLLAGWGGRWRGAARRFFTWCGHRCCSRHRWRRKRGWPLC